MRLHSLVISTAALAAFPASLAAQADWTQLSPMTPPPVRAGHSMAYDSARNQIVMFGGYNGSSIVADTWIFDGTDWSRPAVATPPPARAAQPMAYDPIRQKIVMFGGIASGVALSDTWEWDGNNWNQVFPATNPPGRRSQPMVFAYSRGTVVMWGGNGGGTLALNDMWEFNGNDWSQIVTNNAPPARWATDMAFDPVGGGLVLFSGYQSAADTWYFDNVDWSMLQTTTTPPAMYDQMMVTDWARQRVVMVGDPGGLSNTWEWNGTDWLLRTTATPLAPAREDGYLAYDSTNERVVLFGGYSGGTYLGDTWIYATTAPASSSAYGNGCLGTNGQRPTVGAATGPWIGEPFSVTTTNLAAATAPSVALVGFSNTSWLGTPLPIDLGVIGMTGCSLRTSVESTFPMTVNSAIANLTFTVPNDPTVVGGHAYFQSAHLDIGANGLGLTASNGLDATVGAK